VLAYFTGAVHLGMTATPLREENRDNYNYFGDPIYKYSLKQGMRADFLAPYAVRRVVITEGGAKHIGVDTTGDWLYVGQCDDYGREIADQEYGPRTLSACCR
jgi:type I restriction enzyme R subunit